MNLQLNVNDVEANLIGEGLGKLPAEKSMALILKLRDQVSKQQSPEKLPGSESLAGDRELKSPSES